MGKAKKQETLDVSTEEKIKQAAQKLFTRKGYAATRTRDISEEAGINLALLNYYFRSKEKLFEIVMMENLQNFFKSMIDVLNDEGASLEKKIEIFVANYTEMLMKHPDLPLFVLSEIRANPQRLVSKMGIKEHFAKSQFMKQLHEGMANGTITPMHPLQFIMNMVGLTVFPFVASPVLKSLGDMKESDFNAFIEYRKTMIPKWVKALMKVK
jgi:AcrR family transcriptional regulator